MTDEQSRALKVGDRVCWQKDEADQGVVTEANWAGVTIKWNDRGEQTILHNDMAQIERVVNLM
jgi:hypothetical protein